MDKFSRQLTSSPYVSMVLARRRSLILLGLPLFLIVLLFSGTVNVDNEWGHRLDSFGDNFKAGVSYVTGNGTVQVSYPSTDTATNSSSLNAVSFPSELSNGATTSTVRTKPYARPGHELPLANGIPLRIMALGASTTRGDSPEEGIDNNGFRRPLRERLTAIGNKVNFVGTQRLGNMTDNDIEAYPGVVTETIHGNARKAVPKSKPNVFLINAGSNDCFQHVDIDNFYKRYDALVRYLLEASPRSTIIMGTILPTWDTRFNGREDVWRVNPQIRRLAKIYKHQELPVVLADMQGPDGIQDGNLASDGMHPGTAGYEMMATKMYEAILEADARGFLQPPEPVQGILDDGDDERKDEDYMKWLEEKRALDAATAAAEQKEIDRMVAELAKMKQENADGKQQRRQKDTRLRRHPRMLF
ncbi:carbohydrate esterase family 3 protein [Annulohypoxylon maeteangense]|uniref:carbohydrate esterase family 3 protein n=1 Tax=Annulohypoxylon maeteangense TaxID=1927788 RepID=UPI002007AFAF|nr:carbohydrate esterase family 3 protein [Annulohypoxylon maeteangense]KAI0885991.1 carbohydrate esterase family 3 protein [Annulohypoxylon maeteangense]